jgi:hypothetical protein
MDESFNKIIYLVIILNILPYLIKSILKRKGYSVSWFRKHLRDILNLWDLFKKTQKASEKLIYFALGTGFPILTIVFIISVVSYMSDFAKVDKCAYEEQFRQTEWNGIVTDKYIDHPNHAFETIEIENDGQNKKIQNWILFQNGNFAKIEIGDSIVKKRGLVNVKLFKSEEELNLIVDYGCDKTKNNKR